jgi:hypothetical protein
MGPWGRRLVTLAVVGALIAPVVANHDSFPLSTYPMYARTRPTEVDIVTAVGIDSSGHDVPLSMSVLAATDDPLIAESRLRTAAAGGTAVRMAMCEEIAARSGDGVVGVRLVTERHDVVRRASGKDSRLGVEVHAECEIADG